MRWARRGGCSIGSRRAKPGVRASSDQAARARAGRGLRTPHTACACGATLDDAPRSGVRLRQGANCWVPQARHRWGARRAESAGADVLRPAWPRGNRRRSACGAPPGALRSRGLTWGVIERSPVNDWQESGHGAARQVAGQSVRADASARRTAVVCAARGQRGPPAAPGKQLRRRSRMTGQRPRRRPAAREIGDARILHRPGRDFQGIFWPPLARGPGGAPISRRPSKAFPLASADRTSRSNHRKSTRSRSQRERIEPMAWDWQVPDDDAE
jgi:hypothetical protein